MTIVDRHSKYRWLLVLDDDCDQLHWNSEWLSLLGHRMLDRSLLLNFLLDSSSVLVDVLTFECVESVLKRRSCFLTLLCFVGQDKNRISYSRLVPLLAEGC